MENLSTSHWETLLVGGEKSLKRFLGVAKLLWTVMGAAQFVIIFLSLKSLGAQSRSPFDLGVAFSLDSYLNRGALFVIAPLLAAGAFLFSLRIFGAFSRAALRLKDSALGSEGQQNLLRIQIFIPALVISLACGEVIALFGLLLSSSANQGAYIVPFAAASLVTWLRAYPSRMRVQQFFEGSS